MLIQVLFNRSPTDEVFCGLRLAMLHTYSFARCDYYSSIKPNVMMHPFMVEKFLFMPTSHVLVLPSIGGVLCYKQASFLYSTQLLPV